MFPVVGPLCAEIDFLRGTGILDVCRVFAGWLLAGRDDDSCSRTIWAPASLGNMPINFSIFRHYMKYRDY